MAKCASRVLAMLLVLGLATVLLPWHETGAMHAETVPSGGCHQQGATSPAPTPSSYRCCQIEHNSALLQVAANPRPPLFVRNAVHRLRSALVVHTCNDSGTATVSSPDPPCTIPLRV